jgi:hypothetical protein
VNNAAMWRRELTQARENLALVSARKTEYVLETDVPLQLVKEERRLQRRIRWLEGQTEQATPLILLRQATKLLTERVARVIDGQPWKGLKSDLLTQASKLPVSQHLDAGALRASSTDLAKLIQELRVLLQAHRIRPNPGQLEALEQHAAQLAGYLVRIYRLAPGEAPELEALIDESEDANDSRFQTKLV